MNSLPDFDPNSAVPLRFGQVSRLRAKPAAAAPAATPTEGDLAAELEAALMRGLKLVASALPASPDTVPENAAAGDEARPRPAGPRMPATPGLSAFAPKPRSEPVPVEAPRTKPAVSPYAPARPRTADRIAEPLRHEAPANDAMPQRAATRWEKPQPEPEEAPDWLADASRGLEAHSAGRTASRIGRASLAVAVVIGLIAGGGALVVFGSAGAPAPEAPRVAESSDPIPAIVPAQESAALPLPQPEAISTADPADVGPPMSLAPAIQAEAGAGPLLLADEAAGEAGVAPPAQAADPVRGADGGALALAEPDPPQPELRSTATDPLDVVVATAPPPKRTPAAKIASGAARITIDVNMRSGPDNNAPSVKVLRAGSTVKVLRCDYWCEVDAGGGLHGWVFKRFLKSG